MPFQPRKEFNNNGQVEENNDYTSVAFRFLLSAEGTLIVGDAAAAAGGGGGMREDGDRDDDLLGVP